MKSTINASVLAATIALGSLSAASAEDQFYVGLRGAYVDAGTTDNQFDADSPSFTLDYGSGYAVALDIGQTFGQFRAELEVGHSRVGPTTSNPATGVSFELSDNNWTGLAGIYYDIPVSSRFSIYIGGGGGIISREATVTQLTPAPPRSAVHNESTFGVFGEAGVEVTVSDDWSVFTAYRYLEHNDDLSTSSSNVWGGIRKRF